MATRIPVPSTQASDVPPSREQILARLDAEIAAVVTFVDHIDAAYRDRVGGDLRLMRAGGFTWNHLTETYLTLVNVERHWALLTERAESNHTLLGAWVVVYQDTPADRYWGPDQPLSKSSSMKGGDVLHGASRLADPAVVGEEREERIAYAILQGEDTHYLRLGPVWLQEVVQTARAHVVAYEAAEDKDSVARRAPRLMDVAGYHQELRNPVHLDPLAWAPEMALVIDNLRRIVRGLLWAACGNPQAWGSGSATARYNAQPAWRLEPEAYEALVEGTIAAIEAIPHHGVTEEERTSLEVIGTLEPRLKASIDALKPHRSMAIKASYNMSQPCYGEWTETTYFHLAPGGLGYKFLRGLSRRNNLRSDSERLAPSPPLFRQENSWTPGWRGRVSGEGADLADVGEVLVHEFVVSCNAQIFGVHDVTLVEADDMARILEENAPRGFLRGPHSVREI